MTPVRRRPMHRAGVALLLMAAAALARPVAHAAETARQAETTRQAAAVRVDRIDFGVFERAGDGALSFRAANVVPRVVDQGYGWIARVTTSRKTVRVREELTLPHEPKTWGDPEPGLKQRLSTDGRTATTELHLTPVNGAIVQAWSVAPGDPAGTYTVRIWIENEPPRTITFQVR